MMFSLENKTAIVTGSARGNGKAIADGFRKFGATVLGLDIIESNDSILCDITNQDEVKAHLDQLDKIDILVNNAGVTYVSDFVNYPDEFWDKTYEINLKAPYKLIQYVAPKMTRVGGGSIINVTSLNAELAFPNNP